MGISSDELSARIGMHRDDIDALLSANSAVTAQMAVQLEHLTNISAHYWLKSQKNYEYFRSRRKFIPMAALDLNKRYTYADCLAWPEGFRCEIIDGFARALPPVNRAHGTVSGNLSWLLYSYIKENKLEYRFFSGIFDVRLPKNSEIEHEKIDTVVQPDLCIVCDPSKIDEYGCCGTPDMIIEILSPATIKNDCIRKFLLYEEHGVKEYWMVHPNDMAVTIFLLQKNGKYEGALYEFEGKIPVKTLNNYLLDLDDIFNKND